MAQFPKIQLTQLGKNMIMDGQNKKPVAFTKVELGDGLLSGQSVEELTALVHGVMSVPLQNFTNNGDGTAHLRFVLDNNTLDKGFFNREIGVYAKVGDGSEQLYAYTNAANLADYIPGKESPITSKIINLHLIIGNTANISIVAENSAYATKIDIEKHRTAAELDHPDGSVTTKKLSDAAVTGAKIANKAIGKEHLQDGVVDDKAPIASPALTGTPTVPTASKGTNTDQIASTAFVAQAVAALNGLDSMDKLAKEIEGKLGKQGIVAGNLESNGWVKFADGLIVQWGIVKEVHFDSTDIPVTFPIAFTKSCFVVIPTLHQPIATGGSITAFVKRGTITLQGCTCVADHSNERPTGDMFFLTIGI